MDLTEEVKKILKTELNLQQIDDMASQSDHPEWDSLSYLRIIAALEQRFGIEITSKNINHFNSISNIVNEIENQKNHR